MLSIRYNPASTGFILERSSDRGDSGGNLLRKQVLEWGWQAIHLEKAILFHPPG
jgi:hypothetical protein